MTTRALTRAANGKGRAAPPARGTRSASLAFDRKAQFRQKKRALLEEAVRVFNQHGYANAALEDVAANLNISKAALYYYFKSKQEILYECYAQSFDIWEGALAEAQAHGRTGREKVEIYIRRYLENGLGELHPMLVIRDQEALSPEYRQKIERRRRTLRNRLREFVAEGIADGSLARCNPKLAVTIIGASISWLLRMYRPDGELTPAVFAEEAVGLLLGGLAGGSHRRRPDMAG